jgi:predicted glycoside hydrolase/deacetylase ChbG (UPF0249 family)
MKIVLNADDFGYDADTLRATIDCFEQGALTSASIMANMPETAAAMEYAKAHPQFSFGVHLTFVGTEAGERPISDPKDVPALCDGEGKLLDFYEIRRRAMKKQIPREQIERETVSQIAVIRDHGVPIAHVDSHQHVHKFGPFLSVLEESLPRFGVRHLRTVQDTYFKPKLSSPTFWLGGLWHRRIAKHFATTEHFFMATCRHDMQRMGDLVPTLKGESIEVGVHPGYTESWRVDERNGAIAFAQKAKAAGHKLVSWNEI